MWREREREREVTTLTVCHGEDCLRAPGPDYPVQTLLEKCYIYYWKVLRLHKRRNGITTSWDWERESQHSWEPCLVFNLNLYRCNKSPPSSLSSLNKIKTSFKHKTPPLHSPNLKLNRLGTKFIKIWNGINLIREGFYPEKNDKLTRL